VGNKQGSIESLLLQGEAGGLEALLNLGSPQASCSALVCHPHPLFGGTMHNKVVFRAAKALNAAGFPVLRFNFRGVGLSVGEHDDGRGETGDVRVALDYLASRFGLPIVFAGYSFGAAVGARAASAHSRVAALLLIGSPIHVGGREYSYDFLESDPRPKLFVSGGQDQFAPLAALQGMVARAAEPKRLAIIPEANHSFSGHLDELGEAVHNWAAEIAAAVPHPGSPTAR
jgi:uncharacterized protein